MKVAVLLSGFPRNYKQTYRLFEKYIILPLSPDIFFYGYHNFHTENNEEDLLNLYKFKKYCIRHWTKNERDKIYDSYSKPALFYNIRGETQPDKILSQYYNLFHVNELKKEYEKENNFIYDLVIRCRMDVFFCETPSQELIDFAVSGKIIIPSEWDFKTVDNRAVSDSFAMSTSKNIDIYCNLFNCMNQYVKSGDCKFHPETLFGVHLIKNGIERVPCGWIYTFHIYDESRKEPVGKIIQEPNRYSFNSEAF